MNRVSVAANFVRQLTVEYDVSVEDINAVTSDTGRMRAIANIIKRDSPQLDQPVMLLPCNIKFKKSLLRAGGVPEPTSETLTTLREVLPHITLDSLCKARHCGAQTIVKILVFMKEHKIDLPQNPYKKLCELMQQNDPSSAEMILFLQRHMS